MMMITFSDPHIDKIIPYKEKSLNAPSSIAEVVTPVGMHKHVIWQLQTRNLCSPVKSVEKATEMLNLIQVMSAISFFSWTLQCWKDDWTAWLPMFATLFRTCWFLDHHYYEKSFTHKIVEGSLCANPTPEYIGDDWTGHCLPSSRLATNVFVIERYQHDASQVLHCLKKDAFSLRAQEVS